MDSADRHVERGRTRSTCLRHDIHPAHDWDKGDTKLWCPSTDGSNPQVPMNGWAHPTGSPYEHYYNDSRSVCGKPAPYEFTMTAKPKCPKCITRMREMPVGERHRRQEWVRMHGGRQ